ncbi:hypothetical protein LBE40_05875 [Bartonella taylorii]|nr:hypothetical protein [Bartonella taylorii]USP00817.1 hypothetical protein LBE40_05875 [Bartonella taylorii]
MTERVVIACLAKMFLKKYPPNDSKKVGGVMMQEWIKIFLTGFVSFVVSLSVALILRNKDRKEAAKIRKDDLEKAAKKREEDREWATKQFAESQKQTAALKKQADSTKDLAESSKRLLSDSRKDLEIIASLEPPEQRNGFLYNEFVLKITNLTTGCIAIRNIQISENCPFEFLENACWFKDDQSDLSKDFVVIKRTTPKHISLKPKEIKSNATEALAISLFCIPYKEYNYFYLRLSLSKSEYNLHNIVNGTLKYTSLDNPDELITIKFGDIAPRLEQRHDDDYYDCYYEF